jgi:DNA invertase Pin-like site-specific DNA recombinase
MAAKRGPDRPQGVIGYVRVSTQGQGATGISLDIQRDAIGAFADHLGIPLIEIFEDVASGRGAKSFPSRNGLRHAFEAVRDHDAMLVVWDWSRLSRHADDLAELTTLLPGDDRIVSVKGGNALAEAAKAGQLLHAQRSGEEISRRTREAMAKQKASGAVFGNPDILGTQRLGAAAMAAKSDALVKLIAEVLRSIPDHEKLTRAAVAERLNALEIVTGAGSSWDASRVTVPLKKARLLLKLKRSANAQAAARAHPDYGRF